LLFPENPMLLILLMVFPIFLACHSSSCIATFSPEIFIERVVVRQQPAHVRQSA